jgi:hypothetical protein
VTKVLAKELYEGTDIPNLSVTKTIGRLKKWEVEEALHRGMQTAEAFQERGLIRGVFLAVKDQHRISNSIMPLIQIL